MSYSTHLITGIVDQQILSKGIRDVCHAHWEACQWPRRSLARLAVSAAADGISRPLKGVMLVSVRPDGSMLGARMKHAGAQSHVKDTMHTM